MIHRTGMVQPSAFRFLPSALLPPKDTINSFWAAGFEHNPLWFMRVKRSYLMEEKKSDSFSRFSRAPNKSVSTFFSLLSFLLWALDSHLNSSGFLSSLFLLYKQYALPPTSVTSTPPHSKSPVWRPQREGESPPPTPTPLRPQPVLRFKSEKTVKRSNG